MNAILALAMAQAWALDALTMEKLVMVLTRWADGDRLTAAQIDAAIGDAPQAAAQRRSVAQAHGGVAILPLYGVISHRAHMVQNVSGPGGTSNEAFASRFRAAIADPEVSAILIDTDSPGGSVAGTPELTDLIYSARGQKPIVASANATMASAAYYIASAADEIVATPSAMVGSIGVLMAHEDRSAELAANGRKITYITAGKYKAEGNAAEPLNDEARAAAQNMVDQAYSMMVKAIARNRSVTADAVRSGYGEGRVLTAQDALSAKMIDRIEPLGATIERLSNPRRRAHVGTSAAALRLANLA